MHGPTRESASASLEGQPPTLDLARDALFLDLDGTLLEIAERPDQVAADEALLRLLRRVAERMDGAVALITGRRVADADRILNGAIAWIAGQHGAERRVDGGAAQLAPALVDSVRPAAATLKAWVDCGALNAVVEDKGASVALHYRHAPHCEDEVRSAAAALAAEHGFKVLEGKMVVEVLPHGLSKGEALAAFMREPPFAGRKPVAVGDDITDEDAFAVASRMGGRAVLVGPARPTAASYRLEDAAAVRDWLAMSVDKAPA